LRSLMNGLAEKRQPMRVRRQPTVPPHTATPPPNSLHDGRPQQLAQTHSIAWLRDEAVPFLARPKPGRRFRAPERVHALVCSAMGSIWPGDGSVEHGPPSLPSARRPMLRDVPYAERGVTSRTSRCEFVVTSCPVESPFAWVATAKSNPQFERDCGTPRSNAA